MARYKNAQGQVLSINSDLPQDGSIATAAEVLAYESIIHIPKVVTMRQARLALHQSGLLSTVDTAIINGTDAELKIEWEFAAEVRRDWASLIAMATTLSLTSTDLDNLFLLASTK